MDPFFPYSIYFLFSMILTFALPLPFSFTFPRFFAFLFWTGLPIALVGHYLLLSFSIRPPFAWLDHSLH
jgi:hypothetical protein